MDNISTSLKNTDTQKVMDFVAYLEKNTKNSDIYVFSFLNSMALHEAKISGVYAAANGTMTPDTVRAIYKSANEALTGLIEKYQNYPNTNKAPSISKISETFGIIAAIREYAKLRSIELVVDKERE